MAHTLRQSRVSSIISIYNLVQNYRIVSGIIVPGDAVDLLKNRDLKKEKKQREQQKTTNRMGIILHVRSS